MTQQSDWQQRLERHIVCALVRFGDLFPNTTPVMFAVDCHPWNGGLYLAILTSDEAKRTPFLVSPEEMAAWKHYDFATPFPVGRELVRLGAEMGAAYESASDKDGVVTRFLTEAALAATAKSVANTIEGMLGEPFCRVSVAHPDSGQEFT